MRRHGSIMSQASKIVWLRSATAFFKWTDEAIGPLRRRLTKLRRDVTKLHRQMMTMLHRRMIKKRKFATRKSSERRARHGASLRATAHSMPVAIRR
jgi:hypothetical protein